MGKKEKEKIEYPQIGTYEYTLFIYDKGILKKSEKYNNSDNLESYMIYDYDNSGNLIKETFFGTDNQPYRYTLHIYKTDLMYNLIFFRAKI